MASFKNFKMEFCGTCQFPYKTWQLFGIVVLIFMQKKTSSITIIKEF